MARDVILTPEGLTRLKDELQVLQTTRRREVAERIKEAREFGDISENSEYDDAKNEQMMLEQRIAQLEERLRSAQVVDPSDISTDAVQVGSVVSVKDEKTGKSSKFTIVLAFMLFRFTALGMNVHPASDGWTEYDAAPSPLKA